MNSPNMPEWLDNAILLYGPRKGGTTLFQSLLDGGDDIFVYPAELKLKKFLRHPSLTPAQYLKLTRIPNNSKYQTDQASEDQAWKSQDYVKHTREYSLDEGLFDRQKYEEFWNNLPDKHYDVSDIIRNDVLYALQSQSKLNSSPKAWGAKEVGGKTREILTLWRRIFPEGKILIITRDPAMVTRSVLRDRKKAGQHVSLFNLFKQVLDPLRTERAIAEFQSDPRVLTIKYEELVDNPDHVMQSVCQFLGISFSSKMITPTMLGRPSVVRTASRPTQKVFNEKSYWYQGLSVWEIALTASLRIAYKLFAKIININ